MQVTTR